MSDEFRTPDVLREELRCQSRAYLNSALTRGHIGSTIGYLNAQLGGDENRRRVIGWLFYDDVEGEIFEAHSAHVTAGQWQALFNWVNSYQDQGGRWQPSMRFVVECEQLLRFLNPLWAQREKERAIQNGQLEMF